MCFNRIQLIWQNFVIKSGKPKTLKLVSYKSINDMENNENFKAAKTA